MALSSEYSTFLGAATVLYSRLYAVVRRAVYSLFPENPTRYATAHLSGLSRLPGDGLCRRSRPFREPCQERVSAQQRGGFAHPLRGIRDVRLALDTDGRLSGQA